MIDPTTRVPSIVRNSASRDSKCRSQYDNFSSVPAVFESSELSSSTEALETLDEMPSCSSSTGQPDDHSVSMIPMVSTIIENTALNNSSSSNENIISSKDDLSENDR